MKGPGWIMEYYEMRLVVGSEIASCSESSRWLAGILFCKGQYLEFQSIIQSVTDFHMARSFHEPQENASCG
jgi:hypothetical protein